MSDEVPDTPSRPDSLLSQASTSSMGTPSWRARWPGRAGSVSPDRVPIMSPSKGVSPMGSIHGHASQHCCRRAAVAKLKGDKP